MQQLANRLLLSASDVIGSVECPHLTQLDHAVATGRLALQATRTDAGDLVARKGDEHEQAYVAGLRAAGHEVVEIAMGPGLAGMRDAAELTREAMASGGEVIYQGVLFDGERWRGYADFLERVDQPSRLGPWSYEVADTKLARSVKPYALLQLCLYSDLLGELQGRTPELMHVVLGTQARESLRVGDFSAYARRIRAQLEAAVAGGPVATYPDPVEHCGLCRWSAHCDARREADDHLSLVARMGRAQTRKLQAAGIATVARLAGAAATDRPPALAERTFERLRQQARLQVDQRDSGEPSYELLEPELDPDTARRGFALLPGPSEGDVFFDIEGDPFYEDGLEYLWGVTYLEDGQEHFHAFWGRDRAEEKHAFEAFIDFVIARRRRYPDLHVYHYASYEPTAIRRLMGLHATREDEVDALLRQNVLVDLYRVVEQSLRISQPSYSIKKIEAFYMPAREAGVTDGEDSILKFEEWLDTREQALLDWIRDYNQEDCHSTLLLRDWLLERRSECETQYGVEIPWRPVGEGKPSDAQLEASEEVLALQRGLLAGVPDDPLERSADEHSRWLLAQLIDYHRREAKPTWWEFFSRFERSEEELELRDSEALAGLREHGEPVAPPKPARSLIHRLAFPAQEHKISEGAFTDPFTARADPETGELDPFSAKAFNVERVLDDEGVIEIRRTVDRRDEPLPRTLIPSTFYPTDLQQAALRELADDVIKRGLDSPSPYRAARAILARTVPRTAAVTFGDPLQTGEADLDQTTRIAAGLEDSYLFVQGPPGSGKTYTGAQLILSLIAAGHRVGVAANSHKAIHNLLHEVEQHAGTRGIELRGLQKHSGGDSRFQSRLGEPLIDATDNSGAFPTGEDTPLMAGTAWLWCREAMRGSVDYLVIDEAGQVSLADALAMATAARNVILLGDPLQLAQVSQGSHPLGSGGSVLEHLLATAGTVQPERGIFLDHTRRMHPDVCDFVSHAVYEGRLSSIVECATQRVDCDGPLTGTGVRAILLDHDGNTRQSTEEAEQITAEIARMIGGRYTRANGSNKRLEADDFMIVTPYNSQVRCLRAQLDTRGLSGVPVGTVDKFQGQEAAVVFFSMATSSGEEIPRNVEFLYSRNRLNVAVSRARCLAVLVCSPELLTIRCRSVEQMRLVNALCLLVELAGRQTQPLREGQHA